MAERDPPPSSTSTPAAWLSRKSGSGADANAADDADRTTKKPKSNPWRGGLQIIDHDQDWFKPVQEKHDEVALSGDENPLRIDHRSGWVWAASPEWQGVGSTCHQWGGARRAHGRADGRVFSPYTLLPRRRPRHYLDEPEDLMAKFAPQDPSLVMKGAKPVFWDKEGTQISEDMRKAKGPEKSKIHIHGVVQKREAEARLKEIVSAKSYAANLTFVFGSRSEREGKVWQCICKASNSPKRKLVFGLPKFHCVCGRKFLQRYDFDFSLADVRVNGELLVPKIFDQKGPHCIANACCQAMLIMHMMDTITKNTEVEEAMMLINPESLISAYLDEYPLMEESTEDRKSPENRIPPSSVHKFIKMALWLKNHGIEFEDGTFCRIGDISFIAKDNFEAICEELGNGVPLLAIITPGVNFEHLKYCEVYRPPLLADLHECNDFHQGYKHEAHMVVLIGPAFKAEGENAGRGYYFVNSHAGWCKRTVMETYHEQGPGVTKPVDYGVGVIDEKGLVYSVIKLWKFGETAVAGSITLEEEDEDEALKYQNKPSNKEKFMGKYKAGP